MKITSCCTFSLNSNFSEKHEIQYFRNVREVTNGFTNNNCISVLEFRVVFLTQLLDFLFTRGSQISTQIKFCLQVDLSCNSFLSQYLCSIRIMLLVFLFMAFPDHQHSKSLTWELIFEKYVSQLLEVSGMKLINLICHLTVPFTLARVPPVPVSVSPPCPASTAAGWCPQGRF